MNILELIRNGVLAMAAAAAGVLSAFTRAPEATLRFPAHSRDNTVVKYPIVFKAN